jgi:hypothetical protein
MARILAFVISFFVLSVVTMLPLAHAVVAVVRKSNLESMGYTALYLLSVCVFICYALLSTASSSERLPILKGIFRFAILGSFLIFFLSLLGIAIEFLGFIFSSRYSRTAFLLFLSRWSVAALCVIFSCIFYHILLIFIARTSSLAFNVTPISDGYYAKVPIGGSYNPSTNVLTYTHYNTVYRHDENAESVYFWVARYIVHLACVSTVVMTLASDSRGVFAYWVFVLVLSVLAMAIFVAPFEKEFEKIQKLAFQESKS